MNNYRLTKGQVEALRELIDTRLADVQHSVDTIKLYGFPELIDHASVKVQRSVLNGLLRALGQPSDAAYAPPEGK